MLPIYSNYLFNKHILVSKQTLATSSEEILQCLYALYHDYNIVINKGADLADRYALSSVISKYSIVRDETAFYRNFPASVRCLSDSALLIDQLCHYVDTYGFGQFDEARYSLFEQELIKRVPAKNSSQEINYFTVILETEVLDVLVNEYTSLASSTRELNSDDIAFMLQMFKDFPERVEDIKISSKRNAVNLLVHTRNLKLCNNLIIADVPKIIDELLYEDYPKMTPNKLALHTKDKKFITRIIHKMLSAEPTSKVYFNCIEKKKFWSGLLHQIHFKPLTEIERGFMKVMGSNCSASSLSFFESAMSSGNYVLATQILLAYKGASYLLRRLNYILSRCSSTDIAQIFDSILDTADEVNPIVLLQLKLAYESLSETNTNRVFTFTIRHKTKRHRETDQEFSARKSNLSIGVRKEASRCISQTLENYYRSKATQKVYIDPDMRNVALPVYMSAGQSGFGVLPTGSRVALSSDILRLFTYWEKVNDIDMSIQAVDENLNSVCNFGWFSNNRRGIDNCIVFSGDQTAGYNGGSEFFDVDLNEFKKHYPSVRYLICCNNVYSGTTFNNCTCVAGYMNRTSVNVAQERIYDPKTVASEYCINANSSMAYMFAVDVMTNEMIWLNISPESSARVSVNDDLTFLKKYLTLADTLNYEYLFNLLSTEIVENAEDADLVISDHLYELPEGVKQIHSYDISEVLKYMNS